MISQRETPDDARFPPTPPEAGGFQDLSFRKMYSDPRELYKAVDKYLKERKNISDRPVLSLAPAAPRQVAPRPASAITAPRASRVKRTPGQRREKGPRIPTPRVFKYTTEAQNRGRPRKYVLVVDEDGARNRRVVGEIYPHADLAPIYIYVKSRDQLVPAPSNYDGRGVPPPLDAEALAQGKSASFFDQYPADTNKKKKMRKRQSEADKRAVEQGSKRKRKKSKKEENPKKEEGATEKKRSAKKKKKDEGRPSPPDLVQDIIADPPNQPGASKSMMDDMPMDSPVMIDLPGPPTWAAEPSLNAEAGPSRQDNQAGASRNDPRAALPVIPVPTSPVPRNHISSIDFRAVEYNPAQPEIEVPKKRGRPKGSKTRKRPSEGTDGGDTTLVDQSATEGQAPPKKKRKQKAVSPQQQTLSSQPVPATPLSSNNHNVPSSENPTHALQSASVPDPRLPPSASSTQTNDDAPRSILPPDLFRFRSQALGTPTQSQSPSLTTRSVLNQPDSSHPPSNQLSAPPGPSSLPQDHASASEAARGLSVKPEPDLDSDHLGGPSTPTQRSPSPMIGSEWSSDRPLFTLPPSSEPKQQAYHLPKALLRFSENHKAKAALSAPPTQERSSTPAITTARAPIVVDSAPPTPSPLTRPSQVPSVALKGTSHDSNEIVRVDVAPTQSAPTAPPEFPADAIEDFAPSSVFDDVPAGGLPAVSPLTGDPPIGDHSTGDYPAGDHLAVDLSVGDFSTGELLAGDLPEPVPAIVSKISAPRPSKSPKVLTPTPSKPSKLTTPAPNIWHRPATSTPLREMTPASAIAPIPASGSGQGRSRIDMSLLRRENEVLEALREVGGVMANQKLRYQHNEWAVNTAGTDHPFAPAVPYLMDRSVFLKTLNHLINGGRLKETISSVPTTTGRWIKLSILYIPDTPWETVQTYIRSQSDSIMNAMSPKRPHAPKIAATEFTNLSSPNVATPTVKSKLPLRAHAARKRQGAVESPLRVEIQADASLNERREALLQDGEAVTQLYGYTPARNVRSHIMHRALVRAMTKESGKSTSVMSTSPPIFALPLLTEDITAFEWFSMVHVGLYDEKLHQFLNDPANNQVKMADLKNYLTVPTRATPHGAREKYRALLSALVALRLLEPLIMASQEDHTISCPDQELGGSLYFKQVDNVANATYFRLYEFAPIHHLAGDIAGFLGILSVSTETQIDAYWASLKAAALTSDVNRLPRIQSVGRVPKDRAAEFKENSEIPEQHRTFLTSASRWRPDLRLHPVQRDGLDLWVKDNLEVTESDSESFDSLAWEFVVPRGALGPYIARRREVLSARAAQQASKVTQMRIAKKTAKEKKEEARRQAEESLRLKLAERAARQKSDWEGRVKAASNRTKAPYSEELVKFVARHTIQTSQISSKGAISDPAVDEACRIFMRHYRILPVGSVKEAKATKAPITKIRKAKEKRVPKKKPKTKEEKEKERELAMALIPIAPVDANGEFQESRAGADVAEIEGSDGPKRRKRKTWSAEDDELLLDCEAIIRARARDLINAKGRYAINQVIHGVGHQTLLSRVKRILQMPGKAAYFARLTDTIYELWMQHRGTELLPDPDPESIINFDLRLHLEFFRSKLHKPSM